MQRTRSSLLVLLGLAALGASGCQFDDSGVGCGSDVTLQNPTGECLEGEILNTKGDALRTFTTCDASTRWSQAEGTYTLRLKGQKTGALHLEGGDTLAIGCEEPTTLRVQPNVVISIGGSSDSAFTTSTGTMSCDSSQSLCTLSAPFGASVTLTAQPGRDAVFHSLYVPDLCESVEYPTATCSFVMGPSSEGEAYFDPVTIEKVAVGANHTCASGSGFIWCWGSNSHGQLGNGVVGGTSAQPVRVVGGESGSPLFDATGLLALTVGDHHTCALRADHRLYCWGDGSLGQLGVNYVSSPVPKQSNTLAALIPPPGPRFFDSVQAGADFTCGTDATSHLLHCWGNNALGQLGINSTVARLGQGTLSVRTNTGTSFTTHQYSLGRDHGCALSDDAAHPGLFCWGNNSAGQLGLNQPGSLLAYQVYASPVSGVNLSAAFQVALGGDTSCLSEKLPSSGSLRVRCWGDNRRGQFGVSPTTILEAWSPREVNAGMSFFEFVLGSRNAFYRVALGSIGEALALGDDSLGQLGDALTRPAPNDFASSFAIVKAPSGNNGLTGVRSLEAGGDTACAVTNDSHLLCWGLEPGTLNYTDRPVSIGDWK